MHGPLNVEFIFLDLSVVHVTMSLVSETVKYQMIQLLMNNKLERVWKEAVMS